MEKEPIQPGDMVRHLGIVATYCGMIDGLAMIAQKPPNWSVIFCRSEELEYEQVTE